MRATKAMSVRIERRERRIGVEMLTMIESESTKSCECVLMSVMGQSLMDL